MSNEWFIIANRFSNSGKAKSLVDKAVKKLKEEKIKYSLNLTINSGDEIDLVKSATKNGYNKILAIGGDGTVQKVVAGIVMQQSISHKRINPSPRVCNKISCFSFINAFYCGNSNILGFYPTAF